MEFIPLCSLNLSEEEAAMLYYELRTALERMLPNNMVDACDYEVLTVFPFKRGEYCAASDDYEVENFEVGMLGTRPALRKVEEGDIQCETLAITGASRVLCLEQGKFNTHPESKNESSDSFNWVMG